MRWTKEEVRIDGEMESGVEWESEAGGNGQGAKRREDRARRGEARWRWRLQGNGAEIPLIRKDGVNENCVERCESG